MGLFCLKVLCPRAGKQLLIRMKTRMILVDILEKQQCLHTYTPILSSLQVNDVGNKSKSKVNTLLLLLLL